jgi:hypothetical protein
MDAREKLIAKYKANEAENAMIRRVLFIEKITQTHIQIMQKYAGNIMPTLPSHLGKKAPKK